MEFRADSNEIRARVRVSNWEVQKKGLGFGLREKFGESVGRRRGREVAESGHRLSKT